MPFSALPFAILPVIDEGSDGGPVVVTHQAFAVCSDVSEPKLFWRLRACRHHHANPAFHNFPQVQVVLSRVDSGLAEKVVRDFHRGLHVLHFSRKYGFMQICRQGFASPQAIELQTQARTGTNWLVRGATSSSGSAVDWARREFLGDGFGAFDGMVAANGELVSAILGARTSSIVEGEFAGSPLGHYGIDHPSRHGSRCLGKDVARSALTIWVGAVITFQELTSNAV